MQCTFKDRHIGNIRMCVLNFWIVTFVSLHQSVKWFKAIRKLCILSSKFISVCFTWHEVTVVACFGDTFKVLNAVISRCFPHPRHWGASIDHPPLDNFVYPLLTPSLLKITRHKIIVSFVLGVHLRQFLAAFRILPLTNIRLSIVYFVNEYSELLPAHLPTKETVWTW